MRKPVVGEKLFLVSIPHYASDKTITFDCTVIKVGRKYFDIQKEGWNWSQTFHIDTWIEKTDYSPHFNLYENEQAWLNEKERQKYEQAIRKSLLYHSDLKGLSLDTTKKIAELLKIEIKNE